MAAPRTVRLTRREREIMNALFALGNQASAEDIRQQMTQPPSYSAVRTMLARLEKKGFIRHREEGARYLYSATVSATAARRRAFREYLKVFFGGSRSRMVAALLHDEPWTSEELEILQAQITRVRQERND